MQLAALRAAAVAWRYEVERVMYHPMQISVVDIGILMYNEDEIHPVGHDLTAPMGYGPWALLF